MREIATAVYITTNLKSAHLWHLGNFVRSSCSLDRCWSVSCIHPGRPCSRPSHSMSLGEGCGPQEDRSDTPACPVMCPKICSHTHQSEEH